MTTFETTAPALAAAAKSAAGLSPNSGKPGRIVAVKTRSDGDENVRLEARTITSVVNYAVDVTDEWYLKGKPHVHGQVKLTLSRRDHKGSIKTSGTDDYATFLFQWIALWRRAWWWLVRCVTFNRCKMAPTTLGLGEHYQLMFHDGPRLRSAGTVTNVAAFKVGRGYAIWTSLHDFQSEEYARKAVEDAEVDDFDGVLKDVKPWGKPNNFTLDDAFLSERRKQTAAVVAWAMILWTAASVGLTE